MWSEKLSHNVRNADYTISEIRHQPKLWKKIWNKVYEERAEIREFLDTHLLPADNLILTGAGTSAYIGLSVQGIFRNRYRKVSEPISTTHIVSHPADYLLKSKNLFLVSFARSGNSPESTAVLDLANQFSASCKHLIITCNKDGELANKETEENAYAFVLPEEANDKSLAMTSSYTGMMLAAILIARIDEIEVLEAEVDKLVSYGEYCLSISDYLFDISNQPFSRALFLGSGPMYGVAKEAQLKMQELTDGMVICKHDSFLGVRHGPKAIIDEETLVIHHLSTNAFARKYELDLINSLKTSSNPLGQLIIGENIDHVTGVDWMINLIPADNQPIDEDFLAVASIVPAQLLGLSKSIQLGLKPDNPSRNGAISRVVQGVNIYNINGNG